MAHRKHSTLISLIPRSALVAGAVLCAVSASRAEVPISYPNGGPSTLVLYDGPDAGNNPGRSDALSIATLMGHFTTRRVVEPLEGYRAGDWKHYDAVFCIIYRKTYTVPAAFLHDVPQIRVPFCWLGNQSGALGPSGFLLSRGLRFKRLWVDAPLTHVLYKDHTVTKGDPDTNIFEIVDPNKATAVAEAFGPKGDRVPYIIRSGNFWIVTDSPYSYADETDRYLVFADVLHDIYGIQHAEDHRALIRIEDINALSSKDQLNAMTAVFRSEDVPFSFGFVPLYVNPVERLAVHLWEKPEIVEALKRMVAAGGVPVLHGYTHQYRGTSTDDYEFWDDLRDRPVRGDSENYATRRIEEALKQSFVAGLYPVTWETPHYAASPADYRAIHKIFATSYERSIVTNHLGTDPLLPYPVIDLYGRHIIPEDMNYVQLGDTSARSLIESAKAALVVRDGYASAFFHPFLNPSILVELLRGFKKLGYHFVDLRSFPNAVIADGTAIATVSGSYAVGGSGKYLVEHVLGPNGRERSTRTIEVDTDEPVTRTIQLGEGETYVVTRQNERPPNLLQKLLRLAKGDVHVLERKRETLFTSRTMEEPVSVVILWNPAAKGEAAVDQQSFFRAFESMGFDIEKIDASSFLKEEEALKSFGMLIVPQASATLLSDDEVQKILHELSEGIVLITDGDSALAGALGMRLAPPAEVEHVTNNVSRAEPIRWLDRPSVSWVPQPVAERGETFYTDGDHERPLVVGGEWGQGQYVYFAPLYDPKTGFGYGRFPDFPFIIFDRLHTTPMFRRNGADVYFDPGYRQNISIERLAKMWKSAGIRAVHAAAWQFYDKYSYDYARLIKVAHQNGILVYAWFEWPHVSQRFWNSHPEWREKSGTLTDARGGWRLLMNLQDPKCQKTILSDMDKMLKDHDWDGVDIAEFSFESPAGPDRPDLFTPFNTIARHAFEKRYGFDPLALFDPSSLNYWKANPAALDAFYAYRKDVIHGLLDTFLRHIDALNKRLNAHWEIVCTTLDSVQHPQLSDYLGYDMNTIMKIVNRDGATLQVEDPASEWSKEPGRYTRLGEVYKRFKLSRPFIIDINVLPTHKPDQKEYATNQPTGSELIELWRAASAESRRVCLYSEASISEPDWEVLPYAMAADARVQKEGDEWVVDTPFTVQLELGGQTHRVMLDDEPWSVIDHGVMTIPAGNHRVRVLRSQRPLLDKSQLTAHVTGLTGELLDAQPVGRGVELEYRCDTRCLIGFDKEPIHETIDGESTSFPLTKSDNGWVISAPPGQHRLRVYTQNIFSYAVDFTSWVSASLIVLFGMLSSGLLAILFTITIVRRRLRVLRHRLSGRRRRSPSAEA